MHRSIRIVVSVAALLLGLAVVGPARAATTGGFNDWQCVPSVEHPNPVVFVHGLGAPAGSNGAFIGPQLAAAGWCAFSVDYGSTAPLVVPGGFAPMDESAAQIRQFIAEVRAATGAAEVDIVGHSEGALHSLYVPKRFGLGDEVGRVVALAPPTHGTTASNVFTVARTAGLMPLAKPFTDLFGCFACDEIAISESFIQRLNDGPITVPGVTYTVIATRFDYVVTPTETAFVEEPGVTNIVVQDVCPNDPVGHGGLAFDWGVLHMITNALDPANATPVVCSYGFPS